MDCSTGGGRLQDSGHSTVGLPPLGSYRRCRGWWPCRSSGHLSPTSDSSSLPPRTSEAPAMFGFAPLSPQRYPNRTQSSGSPFCPTFIQEQTLQGVCDTNAYQAHTDESNSSNNLLFPNVFDQRMAGQAMLAIVSWLKGLTTKARRQPVKVVKLAGSLASAVGPKTQQKSTIIV